MSLLSRLYTSTEAEVAVKQFIDQLIEKTNQGIKEKVHIFANQILNQMIPQHSIDNINSFSNNILTTLHLSSQPKDTSELRINEPRPIFFDKQMQRTPQIVCISKLTKTPTLNLSNKQNLSKSKKSIDSHSKASPQRYFQGRKQQYSNNSIQLDFTSITRSSDLESNLRNKKEEEQKRKQRNEFISEITQQNEMMLKQANKQIGSLLHLKKEYTYDYNGGIIPVSKIDRVVANKVQMHYEVIERNKERSSVLQHHPSKAKQKIKRTQFRLDSIQNCFYDNKSPFYKNFEISKKTQEKDNFMERPYNDQLSYMRILTQDGTIKKRYARYNNQNSKQNNPDDTRASPHQTLLHPPIKHHQRLTRSMVPRIALFTPKSFSKRKIKLPRTDRIKIMNESLRLKFIDNSIRFQTQEQQTKLGFGNSKSLGSSQILQTTSKGFYKALPELTAKGSF